MLGAGLWEVRRVQPQLLADGANQIRMLSSIERGGAGCLGKRGRAEGVMPEAGPRVAAGEDGIMPSISVPVGKVVYRRAVFYSSHIAAFKQVQRVVREELFGYYSFPGPESS